MDAYARNHKIPIEWAEKGVRKEDYVRPYQQRMVRQNRFGVYFILGPQPGCSLQGTGCGAACPAVLELAIRRLAVCMRLPVSFLIIHGPRATSSAVAEDLGVLGVSPDLSEMVFGATATLALRPAADALVQSEL